MLLNDLILTGKLWTYLDDLNEQASGATGAYHPAIQDRKRHQKGAENLWPAGMSQSHE